MLCMLFHWPLIIGRPEHAVGVAEMVNRPLYLHNSIPMLNGKGYTCVVIQRKISEFPREGFTFTIEERDQTISRGN